MRFSNIEHYKSKWMMMWASQVNKQLWWRDSYVMENHFMVYDIFHEMFMTCLWRAEINVYLWLNTVFSQCIVSGSWNSCTGMVLLPCQHNTLWPRLQNTPYLFFFHSIFSSHSLMSQWWLLSSSASAEHPSDISQGGDSQDPAVHLAAL